MAVTVILPPSEKLFITRVSPLTELLALLHAASFSEHHLPSMPILDRYHDRIGSSLHRVLDELSPLWSGMWPRFMLPSSQCSSSDFHEELDRLAHQPKQVLLQEISWVICGGDNSCPPINDPTFEKVVAHHAVTKGEKFRQLANQLFSDPEALVGHAMSALSECFDLFFKEEWESIRDRLEADVQRRHMLAVQHGERMILAGLSSTFVLMDDPPRLVLAKHYDAVVECAHGSLILVPTYLGWPHLRVKHEPNREPLIHYPVSDFAPTTTGVKTLEDARLRLQALSDPTRLQICRLLAFLPHSTSWLADRLELSTPQISKHIHILLEAKLLSRERVGRLVMYKVDIQQMSRIGTDLLSLMLRC